MNIKICVTLVVLVPSAIAFLLGDNCLVPDPCSCSGDSLYCQGTNLAAIPNFTIADQFSGDIRTLSVYFNSNYIVTIDQDAFMDLVSTNATQIEIYLADNEITDIDEDAFRGVEGDVILLDLTNNNLTTVPAALRMFTDLHTILLQGNPISTLSSPVILYLSRSVTSLSFSMDLFSGWPKELHYFRFLSELKFDGYQQPRLPLNSLSGLESTLTSLEISRTKLDRIPSAVCHLKNLRRLSYVSNMATQTPIFEPCSHDMTSVQFLSLRDNNLSAFPNIFRSFPSLSYLDVSQNKIRTIDSAFIPLQLPLTHLNMSYNDFYRVPSAISKLPNVRSLYLSSNRITSLEDNDLYNITALRVLQMDNNPLEYVSSRAFQSQQSIDIINFENTSLRAIPRAITSLSTLRRLDVTNDPIDCSCSMAYLKDWYRNNTAIDGSCEGTGEPISAFLMSVLQLCP